MRDLFGLLTGLDVFFGASVGLLARAVKRIIEIVFTGRMIGLGVAFGASAYDGWRIFGRTGSAHSPRPAAHEECAEPGEQQQRDRSEGSKGAEAGVRQRASSGC